MELTLNNNALIGTSEEMIKRYIDFIDLTNQKTIKGYKNNIKLFLKWLNDKGITNPNRDDIKAYKKHLSDSNLTQGTKNQYFRAVKSLFKWLNSEGLYKDITSNLKGFKVNVLNKKESFNEQDIQKILSDIDISSLNGLRDYAIILLMVIGGLRVSEVSNIDIRDIEKLKGQGVVFIKGKGHQDKDQYIKLIPQVQKAIYDYLNARGNIRPNQPLFISNSNRIQGTRLTADTISKICKKRFKNSGYVSNKLTAHSLRHTSNTLLFKSGADLFKVQQHARHQDPKTTEIYLHINDRELDTSEQDIYNQIFNISSDRVNQIMLDINNLSEIEQNTLINALKSATKYN